MRCALPPFLPTLAAATNLRQSHSFSDTAHWLIPNVLMQGRRPQPHQVVDIVKRTNCTTFVCLQAECVPEVGAQLLNGGGDRYWECDPLEFPTYSDTVREAIMAKDKTTNESGPSSTPAPVFLHYGIQDMNPAKSMEGLMHIVSELSNRIMSGETIYLHCWGGKGRAGLVAACLLVQLYRVDAEIALEFIHAACQLRNVEQVKEVNYSSQGASARVLQKICRSSWQIIDRTGI